MGCLDRFIVQEAGPGMCSWGPEKGYIVLGGVMLCWASFIGYWVWFIGWGEFIGCMLVAW